MKESFSSSAGRHLQDAQALLEDRRLDNAVYLAGYVVECSFKVLIDLYFEHDQGAVKKYGHDLIELDGRAIERLRVIYPILDRQLPTSRIDGTILAKHHPDRRYAKSGMWNEPESILAVKRATEIYCEIIIQLVLDGLIDTQDM